jgi:succinyl-diaminopimelate desuccinylase
MGICHKTSVEKTQALIQKPSVTPLEEGTLDLLESWLKPLGFICERMPFHQEGFESVDNLYARLGTKSPHICFAGHVDVVPVGVEEGWSYPPFSAHIDEKGSLYGRGASDMKGAIAAFVTATEQFLSQDPHFSGSISFLITGDEEGVAVNGTRKMVETLKNREEIVDLCIVGEPTNPEHMGTMVKIGRRGSLNGYLTVTGKQGHVAYPHLASNPIPHLLHLLSALQEPLDEGNEAFQPSNLEITDIFVGNSTTNLIPQTAQARFNIRFNSLWSGESLVDYLQKKLDAVATAHNINYAFKPVISGDSFLTQNETLTTTLVQSIQDVCGITPELSTTGGTSDARFIKDLCPVVEYGLISKTIHQVNEYADVKDILSLEKTYLRFLELYFSSGITC